MEQAKIGPNSIIQTVEALKETYGIPQTRAILLQGNDPHLIDNLPTKMIDEQVFMNLVHLLVRQIGTEQTKHILKRSGQLTAFYLLQHRIPKFFQKLLGVLPRTTALTLLLFAISKNAWTFVGSGVFSFVGGKNARIIISNRPTASNIQPEACSFYCGTFEQIFRVLIDPKAKVEDIEQTYQDVRCAYNVVYQSK